MNLMKVKALLFIAMMTGMLFCCKEQDRYMDKSGDTTPPGKPDIDSIQSIVGGVRVFYTPPGSINVLQIKAEYTNSQGKTYMFASSYFTQVLDVIGMGDNEDYTVKVYAVNRAGVASEAQSVVARPLESTVSRVAKTMVVKPGFNAFLIDWKNQMAQSINVFVHFTYTKDGVARELTRVLTSNDSIERRMIEDLVNEAPIPVKIEIKDLYDNSTGLLDFGAINLLDDAKIPKKKASGEMIWQLPAWGDSIAGIPMMYGEGFEGRTWMIIDDVINVAPTVNFCHSNNRGRLGVSGVTDANVWNLMIDLGDYWELSRIITHQRHMDGTNAAGPGVRGQYYRSENVGYYSLYILNEATMQWDSVTSHKIPVPQNMSELEMFKKGQEGDMAYFYPDEPQYTPPVRWIRYLARRNFDNNYTGTTNNCLSELTLYGRKAK
ncbi:MAG: DUF4959 domain-containing protein [Bacteroidales bacterium]|nr:DUF4959 domain-containing protein [Bacteroidales bacterium]